MIRLAKENTNTAKEYNQIFSDRAKVDPNWTDLRRWKKLLRFYKGGKLLDSGCLDSNIPSIARALFPEAEVWGIDIASEAIKTMAYNIPGVHYQVRDLYDTKFAGEYFDYIVMGEVLEHLEEPDKAIAEAMRILKPRGYLAVSVPLDEAREPGAVDRGHHLWSYTIEDMMDLLKPHGGVRTIALGSQHFPTYKYSWPTLIAWVKKK